MPIRHFTFIFWLLCRPWYHQVKVYVTSTTDPLFNIATEEWIFREGDPTKQTLYLWRNAPTVPFLLHLSRPLLLP